MLELVTGYQGGANGTFLVRARPKYPGEYVLCVIFQGIPSHHLLQKKSQQWTVNGKIYGIAQKLSDVRSE